MKKLFIVCLLIAVYSSVYSQIRMGHSLNQSALDTNMVVYDEAEHPLHYYQYVKLMNTGDYTITSKQSPGSTGAKMYLKKVNAQESMIMFEMIKAKMAINNMVLSEGKLLDIKPLLEGVDAADLENKVIVLVFWSAECPPCTEDFTSINSTFKQISNPEDIVVIAVTRDKKDIAAARLKEKPLLYARLLSNASNIFDYYEIHSIPAYVVADKKHMVRFAMAGSSPFTMPIFKSSIRAVLQQ